MLSRWCFLSALFSTIHGYYMTVHEASWATTCGPMVETGYNWDCQDSSNANSWFGVVPKGNYTEDNLQYFCTGPVDAVPPGGYCIYQNYREEYCPPGFYPSTRQQDEEDGANSSYGFGEFQDRPKGTNFGNYPTWHFCCSPGDPTIPISFDAIRDQMPPSFTLFQYGSSCQKINGRTVSWGYVKWDDEDDGNKNTVGGLVPAGELDRDTVWYYCTYSESYLPYPATSATLTSLTATTATVEWETESGATLYRLRLYKGGTVVQPYDAVSSNTQQLPSLSPITTYTLWIYSGVSSYPLDYETVGKNITFTTCADGFVGLTCEPFCSPSCVHGYCASPSNCSCELGWKGAACDQCDVGFYPTGPSSCGACPDCGPHGACSDGPSGTGNCICHTGYNGTYCGQCVSSYFSSGDECLACDSNCATCSHNSTHCLSCPGNLVLSANRTCILSCPVGQFLNVTCQPCDSRCQTCSGPGKTDCLSCSEGRFLYDGDCRGTCPPGTYPFGPTNQCYPCASSCATCSSGGTDDCLSCNSPLLLEINQCLTECSAGFHLDSSTGHCEASTANAELTPVEQWLPIGVYGLFGLLAVILYFVARRKNPKANNFLIILGAISIVECVTDGIFLSVTFRLPDSTIFYCSLFFTLFPMVLNIGLVTFVFIRETKRGDGKGNFLVKYSTVATLVALISMTNVALLRLLDSKIMNLAAFSMNWDESTHLRGKVFGLVSDIFDNIPQIIIQAFYLSRYGADGVAIASIVASSVSLIAGVVHKLLLLLVLRFDPPKRGASVASFAETSASKEMEVKF